MKKSWQSKVKQFLPKLRSHTKKPQRCGFFIGLRFSETVFAEYIFIETELAATWQRVDQPLCILCRDKDIRCLILAAEPGRRTQNGIGLDSDVTDDLGSFTAKQKMLLLPKTGQRNIQPPSFITGVRHDRGPYRVALVQQVGVQVLIDQLDCFYLVHGDFIECGGCARHL